MQEVALTERESVALRLIDLGRSREEMAETLKCTPNAVSSLVRRARVKLGISIQRKEGAGQKPEPTCGACKVYYDCKGLRIAAIGTVYDTKCKRFLRLLDAPKTTSEDNDILPDIHEDQGRLVAEYDNRL